MKREAIGGILQAVGIMVASGLGGYCVLVALDAGLHYYVGVAIPVAFVIFYVFAGCQLFLWGRRIARFANRNNPDR